MRQVWFVRESDARKFEKALQDVVQWTQDDLQSIVDIKYATSSCVSDQSDYYERFSAIIISEDGEKLCPDDESEDGVIPLSSP